MQDLAGAARRARRTPFFFLAAAGLLALAVAGNTAMFMLTDALLLRPMPIRAEETVVTLHTVRDDSPRGPLSIALVQSLEGAPSFAQTAAYFPYSANLTGAGDAERLQGMRVTGNYFDVLGAAAALGRVLQAADARAPVVVISDGLWKRRFGAAPDAVGKELLLNGERATVVGVLPAGFPIQVRDTDVIAPWDPAGDPRRTNPALAFLRVTARMAPGVSRDQAAQDLDARLRQFRETYPQTAFSTQGRVVPLREDLIGGSPRLMWMLSAGMAIVLLIAAANLANLLLVNGAGRLREFSTRRALGATRPRLLAQVRTELLLLAAAGIAAGIALAPSIVALLLRWGGRALPVFSQPRLDLTAIAVAIACGLLVTAAAGIIPALQLTAGRHAEAAQRGSTLGGRRLRAAFVCAEVALTVLLVIGAGLLVRSFIAVQRIETGFQSSGVFTMRLSLPRPRYPKTADIVRFHESLAERLRALPGATVVASASIVPMNNWLATSGIRPPGLEGIDDRAWPDAHYRMVSSDYFSALGIPLIDGRAFTDADRAGTQPVLIISRGLARKYWGSASPIGAEVQIRDDGNKARTVQIVGVVQDVKHLGPEVPSPLEMYVPIAQVPDATSVWLANNMYWAVRTPREPLSLANDARRELARVDPDVAASFVRSMDQWVELSTQGRRFNVVVIAVFAVTALLLAAAGVYSVAAEAVAVRKRELGIRSALGASAPQLRNGVIWDGLKPVAAGVAAGTALALAAGALLRPFLFGVETRDPITFAAVGAVSLVAALAGLYVPARGATRIDPVIALRME